MYSVEHSSHLNWFLYSVLCQSVVVVVVYLISLQLAALPFISLVVLTLCNAKFCNVGQLLLQLTKSSLLPVNASDCMPTVRCIFVSNDAAFMKLVKSICNVVYKINSVLF